MMKRMRYLSVIMVVLLLLSMLASCNLLSKKPESSADDSSASDWSLPVGSESSETSDFDNTDSSNGTPVPTPGIDPGTSSGGTTDETPVDTGTDSKDNDVIIDSDSLLNEKDSLQFYYEGNNYSYGITQDNNEVISFRDNKGNMLDALSGAGTFVISSNNGLPLISDCKVSGFEQSIVGNNIALVVTYSGMGVSTENAVIQTTYIFYDNHISVVAKVSYNNNKYTISSSASRLNRVFLNGFTSVKKTFNYDWVYPEDDDFPYREVESWITINQVDNNHKIYTFLRSEDIPSTYWDFQNRYPQAYLPLFFEDGNGVACTVEYDLVLETTQKDRDSDYLALFTGRGSDFAAGITPVTKNDDASTVFVGNQVELNMNVTNLTSNDMEFSVRYDVRDYYGNIVDAGIFVNSTAFKGRDANRHIKVSTGKTGKYGIYYLNYMVVTKSSSYREMYPFAFLPEYDYKYMNTSPFGINQIIATKNEPYLDYLNLSSKIGNAITRGAGNVSVSTPDVSLEFLKNAKKRGIRIVASGGGTIQFLELYKDYIDEFIVGNELNMGALSGTMDYNKAFNEYVKNEFNLGYTNVKLKYGKKHVIAGIAGAQGAWYKSLYDAGLWDKFDIIATHPYGYPYAPDIPASSSALWHVEEGLKRNKYAVDTYGYKKTYVTETGYPTVPLSKTQVDLRTQADYNTRCYILSLAYNVQAVMAYCFLDYSNSGVGTDPNDVEYHFGAFYYPDYFGRIFPKPSAISFAGMTRQLEGVTTLSINSKYTQGTVRAFTAQTKNAGNVMVAWSNCSPLPNDSLGTRADRTPTLPWVNQWKDSEKVMFEATGTNVTVKDTMGNAKTYPVTNGKAEIPLTGSPVYIYGVK